MRKHNGFTLIEIMVVVVIIGVLSAIIAPRVMDKIDVARIESAKANLRTFELALKFYRIDNFGYPTTEMGLVALVEEPMRTDAPNWKAGGYLDDNRIPQDPWGQEYQYMSPGLDGSDYEITSYGADRRPGGEGVDADLSTTDL